MLVNVGVGELAVSSDADAEMVTYALGSCIAVLVHDAARRVAGMIHYMLPLSSVSPEKARTRPAMFADTGVPLLFESMYAQGCAKRSLVVKVVGGASILNDDRTFDIGRKNYAALRTMFSKVGISIAAEDVGGTSSRTARISVRTGLVVIRTMGRDATL